VAAKQKPRKNARIAAIKARAEAAKADPEREHERKYASLVQLVAQGANIASTHALFKLLRRDLTGEFKRFRYRLVIDEALDVVGKYDQLTKEDPQILAQQRLIVLDELGRWRWNYAEHPNYKGKFEFLRPLCDNGNLVQARGDVLLWTFPAQFLANFEQVYIATYLFEGQAMSDYLKANGIPYRLRSMSDDKEHLVEHATSRNTKQKHALADLIQIEADPRLNAIGSPTHGLEQPLSKTWYDRLMRNGGDPKDLLGQARRNLGYFFERRARTPSALNMWTCFDGKDGRDYQHESKLRKTLKDDRYTRGFVPVNSKATNSHRRKASLAYMCNRFQDPIVLGYFEDHGIEVRSDLFALTELVQWIWRSRIREGQPIHLYLPSERMRQILNNWVRYTDAEIVTLRVRLDNHFGPTFRDGDEVQKGVPVDQIVHEKCLKEALTVFENTRKDGSSFYAGYCHYCGESVSDPFKDRAKGFKIAHKARVTRTAEEAERRLAEISSYPSRELPARRLYLDSLRRYGIRVAVSEADGITPTHAYFPYTAAEQVVGFREKDLERGNILAHGRMGWDDVDMFGWLQALGSPTDTLYVTEGEFDAVALWQVLQEREGMNPAVVSLNGGVGSAVLNIRRFKEEGMPRFAQVILVFDQDEPGQKAQRDVLLLLPAARTVHLPEKDANDCIIKGRAGELYQAAKAAAV
jgi:hypothetical protein